MTHEIVNVPVDTRKIRIVLRTNQAARLVIRHSHKKNKRAGVFPLHFNKTAQKRERKATKLTKRN